MKSIVRRFTLWMVSAVVLGAFVVAPSMAQDKAKPAEKSKAAAPDKGKAAGDQKVLIDNPKAKAFEVRYKPGEGGGMRERPTRLTRALTDGTMERTYADGKTEKVNWKAGDTRWFPKETFSVKNVGNKEIVLFVVEVK
jgi:hypothetical protein